MRWLLNRMAHGSQKEALETLKSLRRSDKVDETVQNLYEDFETSEVQDDIPEPSAAPESKASLPYILWSQDTQSQVGDNGSRSRRMSIQNVTTIPPVASTVHEPGTSPKRLRFSQEQVRLVVSWYALLAFSYCSRCEQDS